MSRFQLRISVRFTIISLSIVLAVIIGPPTTSAQVGQETSKKEQTTSQRQPPATASEGSEGSVRAAKAINNPDEPSILIYLVGGGRLQVEDLRETLEGIWYTQGGVTTLLDRNRVARIERFSPVQNVAPSKAVPTVDWTISDSAKVENFFLTKFGRRLPMTAYGQSDLHNRWGLDHRQGIDVGLHPDSREGLALIEFLRREKIPFLVFHNAIPGVATGPHIHIGNASHRLLPATRTKPDEGPP